MITYYLEPYNIDVLLYFFKSIVTIFICIRLKSILQRFLCLWRSHVLCLIIKIKPIVELFLGCSVLDWLMFWSSHALYRLIHPEIFYDREGYKVEITANPLLKYIFLRFICKTFKSINQTFFFSFFALLDIMKK